MHFYFEAVVIGVSAGGLEALQIIIPSLPENFKLPVIIVQHRHPASGNYQISMLHEKSRLTVKEADEKERIEPGKVYFAPPGYHLLIESNKTFSLSCDDPVNYSRPSIDVLFESASEVYGSKLIGIILTGANSDGSNGMKKIQDRGGLTIVQAPATALAPAMPQAALSAAKIDCLLHLEEIGPFLSTLACSHRKGR